VKKSIIIVIAIIAVVILGINGRGLLKSRTVEVTQEPIAVASSMAISVVRPHEGIMQNRESYISEIVSDKSIKLSTKLAGYIEHIYVQESQSVKKGDKLIDIDTAELHSSIQALKATLTLQQNDLALAHSIHRRNIELYESGALPKEKLDISKVSVDAKKAALESSKQKLDQLTHQLTYLHIVAPFDGEIDTILLREGDLAGLGKPIISMSSGVKKLLFSYTPHNTTIQKKQKILLRDRVVGFVKSIYTLSHKGLISAEVELTAHIEPPVGSSLPIEVLTKERTGCIVPVDSLLHKSSGIYVMILEGDRFASMPVEVEVIDGDRALISPCPDVQIARASEVKLAQLPAYDNVHIVGAKHE